MKTVTSHRGQPLRLNIQFCLEFSHPLHKVGSFTGEGTDSVHGLRSHSSLWTELVFEPGDWAHIHAHFTVCHCLFVLRFFPPSKLYHLQVASWDSSPAGLGPPHHSVKSVFIPMPVPLRAPSWCHEAFAPPRWMRPPCSPSPLALP